MHIDGIICSNSSMLGHTNSKLVNNQQKTQIYTHLKHGCHVWHAQQAGYGQFFFQTFRISCGEWVEQFRSLRNGIWAIWKFNKSCTGPPTMAMGRGAAQRTWPLMLRLKRGGWWWQWAMVCVCVFVCVERPQKIRSDLCRKSQCFLELMYRERLAIVKLADNKDRSVWQN